MHDLRHRLPTTEAASKFLAGQFSASGNLITFINEQTQQMILATIIPINAHTPLATDTGYNTVHNTISCLVVPIYVLN